MPFEGLVSDSETTPAVNEASEKNKLLIQKVPLNVEPTTIAFRSRSERSS